MHLLCEHKFGEPHKKYHSGHRSQYPISRTDIDITAAGDMEIKLHEACRPMPGTWQQQQYSAVVVHAVQDVKCLLYHEQIGIQQMQHQDHPTNPVCQSEHTHTYTRPFNGPFSGTTQVGQYQKG